jgi:threonine dehydrogenase-like Zn-dependent dehydrogenase
MKAIAVHPGTPDSIHLREIPEPSVTAVPDGRGVLVKVLRVGVDGTDKEINAAEYGAAPEGYDYLVTGHESFGQVVEVGPNVPDTIRPGTYVVASVRRPGSSIYGRIGLQDFTTDDVYYERGINLLHGYLTEYYVEDAQYVFPLPATLREVGVLLEPTTVAEKGINHAYEIQRRLKVWEPRRACILGSGTVGLLTALVARLRGLELTVYSLPQKPYRNAELIEQLGGVYFSSQNVTLAGVSEQRGPFDLIFDATGFSPIVWEAAEVLGKNGVLVLASITGGNRKAEVNSDRINQSFVLGNKVMVGTVNASPNDFRTGVDDLIKAEALFPGWAKQLLTTPIHGLENYAEMIRALTEDRDAIKVFVEVAHDDRNATSEAALEPVAVAS